MTENRSVNGAVRAFYEDMRGTVAGDVVWPLFEDLTFEQANAWTLAFAGTVELSAHMAAALASML